MNQICRTLPLHADVRALESSRRARVGGPTVSALVARSLVQVVEELGVTRSHFVALSGLHAQAFTLAGRRMPRSQLLRLCALGREVTGVPALGLRWAERLRESSFFPVSNLVVHARTVREVIAALRRYASLLCDDDPFTVVESDDEVTLRLSERAEEPLEATQCLTEMIFLALVLHLRRAHADGALRQVRFAYPAPDHRDAYLLALGGLAHFDAPSSELVFHASRLDLPQRGANDETLTFLLRTAELQRDCLAPPVASQVLQILAWESDPATVSMADVASLLGMSVRTLRRRLTAEGRPYAEVRVEARALVAKQLVRADSSGIEHVAERLGYGSASAFYRAFRRWSGTTPGAYRHAARETRGRAREDD